MDFYRAVLIILRPCKMMSIAPAPSMAQVFNREGVPFLKDMRTLPYALFRYSMINAVMPMPVSFICEKRASGEAAEALVRR